MSEMNRGIPEGVTHKGTIIHFEAAKEKRREEKNRQTQWIQERTPKYPFTGVDAAAPASSPFPSEAYPIPQSGGRVAFTRNEGEAGENRLPAENTHTVIDFQKARENRFLNVSDTGVSLNRIQLYPHLKTHVRLTPGGMV
jgi:hypothetical protein